jgi:hypothetical protein
VFVDTEEDFIRLVCVKNVIVSVPSKKGISPILLGEIKRKFAPVAQLRYKNETSY